MDNYKNNKGTIIGGTAGAILTLILIWNREYIPGRFLSALLIISIPWASASFGKYVQRKFFPNQNK